MSEEAAFLRAIQANPADTTAKLVYADWLDEHGEPERAEYLRLRADDAVDQRILAESASRAGRIWVNSVSYLEPKSADQFPTWDEITQYAIGRLDGSLQAYLDFNERVSDLDIVFTAHLVPNTGSIDSLCRAHCGDGNGTVTVEPLDDWVAELTAVLRRWLFVERGDPRPHSSLTIETEAGRISAVDEMIACVRDVLRPRSGWRVRYEPEGFYALDWADVALEAADRVLLLHFYISD